MALVEGPNGGESVRDAGERHPRARQLPSLSTVRAAHWRRDPLLLFRRKGALVPSTNILQSSDVQYILVLCK